MNGANRRNLLMKKSRIPTTVRIDWGASARKKETSKGVEEVDKIQKTFSLRSSYISLNFF